MVERDFNPRSRMGSDYDDSHVIIRDLISIHAPAWGATVAIMFFDRRELFQSTLPHGERLGCGLE